jgi:RNA polymerase sigma-70 factor (ECF subfamily)
MTTTVAGCGPRTPASNPDTEAALVARLRAGDEDAYETLFRSHAGAMLAVARRFLGDTDAAADAVQEAFVSAFRAMPSFEGTARLGTWLHRITVNACLMALRGRRRSRLVPLGEHAAPIATQDQDPLSRTETAAWVRAGIAQLPDAYRTVIRLRDLDGLGTHETARRLGTSVEVVKTRLHRARQALRSLLAPRLPVVCGA